MISYKYDHTHLTSSDPGEVAEFYCKALGARVVRELTLHGKKAVDLDIGGLWVRVSCITGADEALQKEQPAGKGDKFGLHHLGLAVSNLDASAADLKSKGVEFIVEPIESRPGIRYAFIKAPDNVVIELVERSE